MTEDCQIQIERLTECQNRMKKVLDEFNDRKSNLNKIKNEENKRYAEAREKILAHNSFLKKAVDQYTDQLLTELQQTWDTFVLSLEKAEVTLISLDKEGQERQNHIDKIITSKDFGKMSEETKATEKYLIGVEDTLDLELSPMVSFVPGDISQYNIGSLHHTSTNIKLQVIKEYTTEISEVYFTSPCEDRLWISNQYEIQEVKPEVNNLKKCSNIDIKVYGMAVTPSNDLLIAVEGSELKRINTSTGQVTNTNFNIHPFFLDAVYVTRDFKVVMGGNNSELSRQAVVVMDKEGKHKTIYEYDKNNQPLFISLKRITCTHNGNILAIDKIVTAGTCRVVAISPEGDVLNIYSGHPEINSDDEPFIPTYIETTPSDNVIIPDLNPATLHILNNEGHYISHINTRNIGIQRPYSVNFTSTGKIFIGCSNSRGSDDGAKLYEVKLSGC